MTLSSSRFLLPVVRILFSFCFCSTIHAQTPVGLAQTSAKSAGGDYISWREHIIDDTERAGFDLSGSDGLVVGDIDKDGYLDVIVAAELSHLIYLQNPVTNPRTSEWPRLILPMTKDHGSYIRVFFADLDGDGRPEASAANKGAQRPGPDDFARSTPVSVFSVQGDPLQGANWQETVLGNYSVPQNAEPVDIDSDGDMDLIVGTRGEHRLILFENLNTGNINFREHAIGINGTSADGFNLEYTDLNGDGLLDIISATPRGLSWLQQPKRIDDAWNAHFIGTFAPDTVTGLEIADIDGDGDIDILVGSYSSGSRLGEDDVDKEDALGRLGWFENPGINASTWIRHDISRRKRGMFDKFIAKDMDNDGDMDFMGTRDNSAPYDGVFWLEQVRSTTSRPNFQPARAEESEEMPLP